MNASNNHPTSWEPSECDTEPGLCPPALHPKTYPGTAGGGPPQKLKEVAVHLPVLLM